MDRVLSTLLARFDVVEEERGEYYVPCVVHDDETPSLAFRLTADGRLLIHCWAGCSTTEILAALGMSRRDLSGWLPGEGVKASERAQPAAVTPGDQAALAMYVDYTNGAFQLSPAREYVMERFGLGDEHAETLSLGIDAPGMGATFAYRSPAYEKHPRLTVPLMDFQGIPRGLQGRDLSGSCPARWLSITNPNGAAWARWGYFQGSGYRDEVLITEGPGDALTAVGVGFDAVAIRGAGVAKHEGAMDEIAAGVGTRPVYVVGDADEAGERFAETVTRALQSRGAQVYVLSVPTAGDDLTDWRGRNPDAFGEEIDQAIERATRATPVPVQTTPLEVTPVSGPLPLTDLGNAERLYRQLGGHVRRVEGADVFKWVGTHWVQIPVEALYADVRAVIDTMMDEPGHDREKLAKHWATSQDARRVRAMVDMLSSIPGVYARVEQFDAQPHLLAFSNGVVDLRTGALREHRPDDMNTFCLDVAYNPNAHAPRWERFLEECHPNSPDMPDFLQMLTGYGITGEGSERTFILHVGPTTNGKTTFTGALEETFGAATKRADASLFQKRANAGGPRADIVGLRGSRLVISSEWPANMPLDQALMKAVTGDQSITARGVYARTEITFRPTCLVQVDSNYPPDVDATDAALWQRVRVVPWLEDFRGREDRHLSATLRREREGIAAWAVRGAVEWYAAHEAGGGLPVPEAVDRATARYRVASHPLAGFTAGADSDAALDAEFVEDAGGFVPRSLVWTRYQAWAEESGIRHTMTRNKLYDTVRTISGVVEAQGTGQHKGVRGFKGLRDAKADPTPPAASSARVEASTTSLAPSTGSTTTDLFGQAR